MTYIFSHKALRIPLHNVMKYINIFMDGNLLLSKLKDSDYHSYLPSKSTDKVPKSLQKYIKLTFNVI
jgi:hypothetical protein